MKLFFACDRDLYLLPHFFAHYSKLGFTDFYCSQTDMFPSDRLHNDMDLHLDELIYQYVCIWQVGGQLRNMTYFGSVQKCFADLIAKTELGESEWWGVTELDEFFAFGEPLGPLLAVCDQQGADSIFGQTVDKVAPRGALPELRQDVSLEEQFPETSKISLVIGGGCDQKVMMCKGRKALSGGNHAILSPYKAYSQRKQVYHYKWHKNVLKRLRERSELPDDEGNGWIAGNKAMLEYWERYKTVLV